MVANLNWEACSRAHCLKNVAIIVTANCIHARSTANATVILYWKKKEGFVRFQGNQVQQIA